MRLTLAAFPFFSRSSPPAPPPPVGCINFHIFVETQPLALPLRLPRDMCHYHRLRLQHIEGVCAFRFDFDFQFEFRLQLATETTAARLGNAKRARPNVAATRSKQAATATLAMKYCRALPHTRRRVYEVCVSWSVRSVCRVCEVSVICNLCKLMWEFALLPVRETYLITAASFGLFPAKQKKNSR